MGRETTTSGYDFAADRLLVEDGRTDLALGKPIDVEKLLDAFAEVIEIAEGLTRELF
jgi:hypothetical protein